MRQRLHKCAERDVGLESTVTLGICGAELCDTHIMSLLSLPLKYMDGYGYCELQGLSRLFVTVRRLCFEQELTFSFSRRQVPIEESSQSHDLLLPMSLANARPVLQPSTACSTINCRSSYSYSGMEEFNIVCNILRARVAAKHGRKMAKISSRYFMAASMCLG